MGRPDFIPGDVVDAFLAGGRMVSLAGSIPCCGLGPSLWTREDQNVDSKAVSFAPVS